MRISSFLAASAVLPAALGLKILLGNDDGFASANTRETYRSLKADGHEVVLVASVNDQSGMGGRAVFTTSPTLFSPGEFNLIPAGSPSLGTDPMDSHIWYYNGTPAACAFVGLDYVIPKVWGSGTVPDLVVAGPNVGQNLGPFLYTLSGTEGYTYASVGRGIPAIAFSAGSPGGQRPYTYLNKTTAAGLPDPATIHAQLAVSLVRKLVKATPKGQRLLPLGYGVSVNYPYITSFTNNSCINPPFVQTRMTGGAFSDLAVVNSTVNGVPIFTFGNVMPPGINRCINGNCAFPGETSIINGGCESSVTPFTVDYDSPIGLDTAGIRARLFPLVQFRNVTDRAHYKRGLTAVAAPEAWTGGKP